MSNSIQFELPNSEYIVKRLNPSDTKLLQRFYEQCTDYALLSDGHPPVACAAADEFLALPNGKNLEDKFIFGLFNSHNFLIGVLETIRHYPDEKSWWIGLMMLVPEQRAKGNGSQFYKAYEKWLSQQKAQFVFLAVLEENQLGFAFWQKLGFEVLRIAPPQQFGNKVHRRYVMQRPVIDG